MAIDGLARTAHARGDLARARARGLWLDALARYQGLGVPEAEAVRASLDRIG